MPKSLQFSLWGHTLAALLKWFRRAEVVRDLENLKGWSWLLLSIAVAMVPREVVSSDRPRGEAPPQRIDSLSSAMTFHGNACVNQMDVVGQTVTGPQLDLTAWSSGLDTLSQ